MDKLAELNHGAKVVLGSAIALLIVSFFHWFTYGTLRREHVAWHRRHRGTAGDRPHRLAGDSPREDIDVEIGVTPAMITAVLAVLTFVFVLIRFIDKPGSGPVSDVIDRSIWAWLGLILAIVLVAGAWANMKLAGESLTDMKDRVAAMGKGGTGGSAEAPAAPSAPAETPPAPAEPAPPSDSGESSTSKDCPHESGASPGVPLDVNAHGSSSSTP